MKHTITTLLLALCFAGTAQTPFWTEDFAGGIPAGWTNTDGGNQNVLWKWCANPTTGPAASCPSIWDDALNAQAPFASTTASNGFVNVDSDEAGQLNANHVSRLTTTAINCSGKNEVWIKLQSHIGIFTSGTNDRAILRVSKDNVTWTSFVLFDDTDGTSLENRWSDNPEVPIVDISAVAANQATVYLRFQWTGNYEYHWSLDDVQLFGENPVARHDVGFADFFYPVSSFATPVSQIGTDTFGFSAQVANYGILAQSNVKVTAKVLDITAGGTELFSSTLTVASIAPGDTSDFIFTERFTPELPIGEYAIQYSVSADSTDQLPSDNLRTNKFFVTELTFAKEETPTQGFRPSSTGDWTIGNYYVMSTGSLDKFRAIGAEFAFATNPDEVAAADVEASLNLFKVNDDVDANFSNFDGSQLFSPSLEWVGVSEYAAPDTYEDYDLDVAELFDANSGASGVPLVTGGRYFLTMSYADASNLVFHAFNSAVVAPFVSTVLFTDEWGLGGFQGNPNAVLRMYLSLESSTDNTPLPVSSLTVSPNPVRDAVTLKVDFDKATDATITIADINGRVIRMEDKSGLTKERITYNLPELAAGTYLARIATAEGTRTLKFVVAK
jgi:hypothetical protein